MIEKQPWFLYVEDEAFSRKVLQTILVRMMGYTNLTIFEDSFDFLERLERFPQAPDVIFLDIHVKPLDGFAMLRLLRDAEKFQHCKVIAITASILPDDVSKLQQAGFDGLVSKPLMPKIFPDLLGRIMAGEKLWYIS